MSAESLTQAMAEKVIKKVTVFHDHRIEIEYAVQDFLKGGNSVSERAGG
jgi:F0F1-type ATP synthase delta subunit